MKELLKTVIADQLRLKWSGSYIERDLPGNMIDSKEIVVISGIRRCGKSTLMQQIRKGNEQRDYYLNFDDDRLVRFSVEHFQILHELFIELFGEQQTFYFDEVQNIEGWERFVRRLYDYGYKIYITGSNANMLSRELGTHLSGRFVQLDLYPFSFREYLVSVKSGASGLELSSTAGKANLARHFNDYMLSGGFPLYLENRNDQYLKSLYESILYRDVMVRNNLTNEKELLELVYYLASNAAKLTSNSGLAKIIGVKNASTIKNYIDFLQDTYFLFQVKKYDPSLNKQLQNPKKTYFIDNALVVKLGFSFSGQWGRLLENLVYIELRRRGNDVYYHQGKGECDFVLRQGNEIIQAIQVCYLFDEPGVADREIKGLCEALDAYALEEGTILTTDTEKLIEAAGKTIHVMYVWKWLT